MKTSFGEVETDYAIPPGEMWIYTRGPAYIITPDGMKILRIPDLRVFNIGEPRPDSGTSDE
jgi:hypothetical protein